MLFKDKFSNICLTQTLYLHIIKEEMTFNCFFFNKFFCYLNGESQLLER